MHKEIKQLSSQLKIINPAIGRSEELPLVGFNFFKLCKSMNNIQIFNNEQFGQIRIAMNESNEPIFCLADICRIIGIKDTSRCASRLDDDVRQTHPIKDNMGRIQNATFVTESGLYDVIIRSDSPKAKHFRRWITSDVLPSIRKNGMYATDMTIERMIANPDFAIQLLTNLKEEKQKRLEAEKKIYKDAPKVLFADAVSTSQRSCLVAELAKILQQNGVNIGQNRLFSWMRENGYLCQKGQYYNQPTQKAMELGLFEIKQITITKPDGSVLVTTTTKVTGKGQIYFVDRILQKRSA